MIGIYVGTVLFAFGCIITFLINRNTNVPYSNDFWDMPLRIKIGILAIIAGILIICASVLYLLITQPEILLQYR